MADDKADKGGKVAADKGGKVADPMGVGASGKVYRIDHGSMKFRVKNPDHPELPGKPEHLAAGELVRLDPEWVAKNDPHRNKFIDPEKQWVHPDKRRDPRAEELVAANEELKRKNDELLKQLGK